MPETQWMTLLETADIMKRLPIQVTRMCEDGKLEYYMEDGRYFVSRESIDLFMNPRTGSPGPPDPDTNGTARRKYGRAPDDFTPSSESAAESETANGRDETDAAGEAETANGRDETDAVEEETAKSVEEAYGTDDENAEAREDVPTPEISEVSVDAEAQEDLAPQVHAEAQEDLAPQVHAEAQEDLATSETANLPAEVEAGEVVETQADAEAQEDEEQSHVAEQLEKGDPNARAVEILADLRAAIARHAMEHKAFCDEITGLADALESTLSRDGDKTSELTREISSLLARYTRR